MEVERGLEEEKGDIGTESAISVGAPEVEDIRGAFEDFMVRVNGRLSVGGVYERK